MNRKNVVKVPPPTPGLTRPACVLIALASAPGACVSEYELVDTHRITLDEAKTTMNRLRRAGLAEIGHKPKLRTQQTRDDPRFWTAGPALRRRLGRAS